MDLEKLAERVESGETFYAVHYASESFYEAMTEPMGISAIAIHDLQKDVTISLSRLDAPNGVDREQFVLDRYYDFMSSHRDANFLHWNLGGAEFSFEVIAKRFEFLKHEAPMVASPQSQFNVDRLIRERFGSDYAPHGRFQSIASLNDLDLRAFLPGADEAAAYKAEKWNDVARSTATKARLISALFLRLVRGSLRTQNSAGRFNFGGGQIDAVSTALAIGERFVLVQRALARRPQKRVPLQFDDEYDDQYLFAALLAQFFDDVRPEDYVPEYAGGKSRVDFLLPDFELAIELKHTRDALDDRKLGEELLVDIGRYRNARSARHLLVLVFDYEGRLANPRGLEKDLQREHGNSDLAVTVKIFDR